MQLYKLPDYVMSKSGSHLVKHVVESRNLKLYHFTRPQYLSQIWHHGLIPTGHPYYERLIGIQPTDDRRYRHGGICLSIGHPNYRMMNSKGGDFAIIEIDANILWKGSWYAFPTNSSGKEIKHALSQDVDQFRIVRALRNLFSDAYTLGGRTYTSRVELGIMPYQTTDPQAEVVTFSSIEPIWFERCIFIDEQSHGSARGHWPQLDRKFSIDIDPNMFTGRNPSDQKFWTDTRLDFPLRTEQNG